MSLYVRKYRTRTYGGIYTKTGYGALYNWYAVDESAANGGFIDGFSVPTDAQWTELGDHLGGESVAGGKLKSVRTSPDIAPRWNSPNIGAIDEVNFSALPGGNRNTNGTYTGLSGHGRWWSSSELLSTNAWNRDLIHISGVVSRNDSGKDLGYSVRCVRIASLTTEEAALPDGTFLTPVQDFDGNYYQVVKIGNQAWLAQNLRTTHYADGTPIPNVTDNAAWEALTTGAYSWYDNDINTAGIVYTDEDISTLKQKPILRNGKALTTYSRGKYTIEEIDALIAEGFIPVATADELDGLRNSSLRVMGSGTLWAGLYNTGLDKKYVQVGNIDYSLFTGFWITIGDTINGFNGIYDGNNLTINNFIENSIGIFDVGSTGIIRNINVIDSLTFGETALTFSGILCRTNMGLVENCYVHGENGLDRDNMALLVGGNTGVINNCGAYGIINGTGNSAGGLVGLNNGGEIKNSYFYGNVKSSGRRIGGLVGRNINGGLIEYCNANATVETTNSNTAAYVGGLVGDNTGGSIIRKSFALGSAIASVGGLSGGLAGGNATSNATIIDCWADVAVSSNAIRAGGLVAFNNQATVSNSYSIGSVVGTTSVGGLCGDSSTGSIITNSYYDSQTSGQSDTGKGLPRTTAQLKNGTADSFINPDGTTDDTETPANAMFTGWDNTIWDFTDITKYPRLK